MLAMYYQSMTLTGHDVPENVEVISLISTGFDDLGVPVYLGRGIIPSDAIDGQDPAGSCFVLQILAETIFRKSRRARADAATGPEELSDRRVAAPRFMWYAGDVYLPLKNYAEPHSDVHDRFAIKAGRDECGGGRGAAAGDRTIRERHAETSSREISRKREGLNEWVFRRSGGMCISCLAGFCCCWRSVAATFRFCCWRGGRRGSTSWRSERRWERIAGELFANCSVNRCCSPQSARRWRVLTSYAISAGIKLLLPPYAFAPEVVIRINLPVLFFSVGVAIATGILFGLWPALQLSRTQVGQVMQSSARRVAGSVRGRRAHNTLIAAQVALTLLLLAGAGIGDSRIHTDVAPAAGIRPA